MQYGFDLETYPDIPLYNIQAVAAATGIPEVTLRSWERRYQVPLPKRDATGRRLFSDRDIAILRWLRERVEAGISIGRAVEMLRMLRDRELRIPVATFDFSQLRFRLVDAVARLDNAGVQRVVWEALAAAPVEDVCLELLQPALYEIGDQWASRDLSVAAEHFGSNLIRTQLSQIWQLSPTPVFPMRLVVGCPSGELHDIGAFIVALFVRRGGFDVTYVGANLDRESLPRLAPDLKPDAICMSASSVESAREIQSLYAALRDVYAGIRAFGGRAFNENENLRREMDGVYLGTDAREALATLRNLLKAG